jgi:hypothetical protein
LDPRVLRHLSAAPQVPGFTLTNLYYHSDVSAGGNVSFAREVPLGNFTTNLTARLNANLNAEADLGLVAPGYVFSTPVFGRL